MLVRIILMTCLIMVGACSSPPEEQVDGKQPVNESEQLPITKNLNVQAEQLRKTSNELQAMLEQWEKKR
ncbi:hypothetical protein SAMN02746065_1454 [Desulfocicer vacuolatum DSM 3385]|uniref:Lipoprotein n=1 Tax=Desulfocicer vacuolatum DSM 3385 TaxID=1121400 RepID=A0A1W2EV11_9BACT|nr:hypothetical protein [Desulfocicer vacuolatum]SMD13036.1 hypothetical protein SAMN02746065_1454 [Desulfocicer vacuolatum DSM 3385]